MPSLIKEVQIDISDASLLLSQMDKDMPGAPLTPDDFSNDDIVCEYLQTISQAFLAGISEPCLKNPD